jgi:hypothetical protein
MLPFAILVGMVSTACVVSGVLSAGNAALLVALVVVLVFVPVVAVPEVAPLVCVVLPDLPEPPHPATPKASEMLSATTRIEGSRQGEFFMDFMAHGQRYKPS